MGAASTAAAGGVGKLPWRDDLLGASSCSRAAVVATGCSQTLSKQLGPSSHHEGCVVFAAIARGRTQSYFFKLYLIDRQTDR